MSGIEAFVQSSLALGGVPANQYEKSSLRLYMYIYTLNYVHYRFYEET